jgi:hypothetical protein
MKYHPMVCFALACLVAGSKAEERNPPTTAPEVSLNPPPPFQGRRAIESPAQIPDMVPVRHPTRIPVRRIPMRRSSYPTTSPYPTVTPYPTPSTQAPTPTQNAGAAKPFNAAAAKPTFPPNSPRRTTQLDQDMVLGTAASNSALPSEPVPPIDERRVSAALPEDPKLMIRHPTKTPVMRPVMRHESPHPTVSPYPTATHAPSPSQNAAAAKPFKSPPAATKPAGHGRRDAEGLGQYMVPVRHATKRPVRRPVGGGGGDLTAYPTVTAFPTVSTPLPTPSRITGAAIPVKLSIVVEPTFSPNYPRRTTQLDQKMVPIRHATKKPVRRDPTTFEPTVTEETFLYQPTADPTVSEIALPVDGEKFRRI